MKPHPSFADFDIPAKHSLGEFHLKSLSIEDLDRDFEAVMESAAEIKAANPGSDWPPKGMTREENMIDLAWHQKEFASRRSFAWVLEDDRGAYLGCAYVHPSMTGESAATASWWWRTGVQVDRDRFGADFMGWLAGPDWPALTYNRVDMW